MDDRFDDEAIAHSQSSKPFRDRPHEGMTASMLWWFGLFHRWDFIYADAVIGKPNWRTTTSKCPLDASTLYKRWKRRDQLIGVRFQTITGGKTSYLMLDIDYSSQYHPEHGEAEFRRLLAVLEEIGLCRTISIRSSESKGIHLYFPLPEAIGCNTLAQVVQQTLEQAGFESKPGHLEIFPNVRTAPKTLFRGHRLPLQLGSYVLDDNWQPIHNSLERLIESWQITARYQDIDVFNAVIARLPKSRRGNSKISQEWRTRLESNIERGWTGFGQTNDLLKDLGIYARVFKGYSWDDVEAWMLKAVPGLPGYEQFCRHRHEIKLRIRDWVKCNRFHERYFPLGSKTFRPEKPKAPTNEERQDDALVRIKAAIAALKLELGTLPSGVRARAKLICQRAHCSNQTLYQYKKLWHPAFDGQGCVTP